MNSPEYISSLRHDIGVMTQAAQSVGLDVGIPTCPGWTMRDLLTHTGAVHRHKSETLRGDYESRPAPHPGTPSRRLSDASVLAWFEEGAAELLDVCATAELDAPTWTWCPHEHTNAWWVRRMAHETVIHGSDAVIAAGGLPEIAECLAVDGVDEIMDEFLVSAPSWGTVTPTGGVVRLEASDRTWSVRLAEFSGTSPTSGNEFLGLRKLVIDDVAEPETVVATDPASLDLWLWGRAELPDGAAHGDLSLITELRVTAADGTD